MANTIDVVERLRDADRNSVQRMNGSRIFGEAADTIERLRAELAAKVQEGYVVVPVEPTKAMERACMKASDGLPRTSSEYARNVWSSMLIAAAEGGGVEMGNPDQIYVPVRAEGYAVLDNGGDEIARCSSPIIAQGIADAINRDAGIGD